MSQYESLKETIEANRIKFKVNLRSSTKKSIEGEEENEDFIMPILKKTPKKKQKEKKEKKLNNEFLYCPDVDCTYLTTVKFNMEVCIQL